MRMPSAKPVLVLVVALVQRRDEKLDVARLPALRHAHHDVELAAMHDADARLLRGLERARDGLEGREAVRLGDVLGRVKARRGLRGEGHLAAAVGVAHGHAHGAVRRGDGEADDLVTLGRVPPVELEEALAEHVRLHHNAAALGGGPGAVHGGLAVLEGLDLAFGHHGALHERERQHGVLLHEAHVQGGRRGERRAFPSIQDAEAFHRRAEVDAEGVGLQLAVDVLAEELVRQVHPRLERGALLRGEAQASRPGLAPRDRPAQHRLLLAHADGPEHLCDEARVVGLAPQERLRLVRGC
mmetsp:Transcript_24135/g.81127  ORF Transcript_24135/g.81127 Transcript_24135/m.81127 type:complete len:298 (-) Transcript_24135:67-960(-)